MGGILAAVKNKLRLPPPLPACPPNPERIMAAVREYALQIGGIRIYLSRTKLTDAFENNVLEPEHYGDPITNGHLSHVAGAVYHSAALPSPSRPAASFSCSISLSASPVPLTLPRPVRLCSVTPHDSDAFRRRRSHAQFDP